MEARRRNPASTGWLRNRRRRRQKMATRTSSRSTAGKNETGGGGRSSFAWGSNQTGMLAAAAVAGAAVGIAANYGRKMMVQGLGASNWADMLAAEHKAVLALFDKLEMTDDGQTWMRAHCLAKIKNALGKHALEEENAVYPALREANDAH